MFSWCPPVTGVIAFKTREWAFKPESLGLESCLISSPLFRINLSYASVLVCVCVYVCRCPEVRRRRQISWSWFTGICGLPAVEQGTEFLSTVEQYRLLTTETSLQPRDRPFLNCCTGITYMHHQVWLPKGFVVIVSEFMRMGNQVSRYKTKRKG